LTPWQGLSTPRIPTTRSLPQEPQECRLYHCHFGPNSAVFSGPPQIAMTPLIEHSDSAEPLADFGEVSKVGNHGDFALSGELLPCT